MSDDYDVIEEWHGKKEFYSTLNSLFKFNIPVDNGKTIARLRDALRRLLRNFPYEVTSMSTMAISDYLKSGDIKDRSIRRCLALKTKGELISR